VKIKIKTLSLLRDILGETIELVVDGPVRVVDIVEILRSKYSLPRDIEVIAIVNGEVVSMEYLISEDNVTVYLTPPFAGGGLHIDVRLIRDEKPDLNKILEDLSRIDPASGALSIFIGFVKGLIGENKVEVLEYEAVEEAAINQMRKIAVEEGVKHGLKAVVIWHWLGERKPGETTLLIATLGENRSNAIKAMQIILERVKKEVPVFKLEKRSDGEYWIIGDGVRIPRQKNS